MKDGRVLFLDLRQLPTLAYLFTGDIPYESADSEFMRAVLQPGEVAVDVGAHLGWFATLLAEQVGPTGRVIAFEPGTLALRMLRASAASYPQLTVVPMAVSNRRGSAELHVPRVIGNASLRMVVEESETEPCELDTLDGFLERAGLSRPVLVKVDAEGGEMDILDGSRQLLTAAEPPIWVLEMNTPAARTFGYRPEDLIARIVGLDSQGYRAWRLDPAGRPVAVAVHEDEVFNAILVPRWLEPRVRAYEASLVEGKAAPAASV